MKQIHKGKLYNTNTAKELGNFSHLNRGDLYFYEETLYRKATGEYFLHGQGGPASKYAEMIGQNSWSGGEKIIPVSYETARQWAEEHIDADKYMSIFGIVEDECGDGTRTRISPVIDTRLAEKLKKKALEDGVTIAAEIERILNEYL